MEQATMNMSEYTAFEMSPSRYSKHQAAFGKYAASQAAAASHSSEWSPVQSAPFFPNTPDTPGFSMTIAPQSSSTNAAELLTPDSSQNYLPNELATAGNSPLFDELDMGDMQSWESLFQDEFDAQAPQMPVPPSATASAGLKGESAISSAPVSAVKPEICSPQPEAPIGNASPSFSTVDLNSVDSNSVEMNSVEMSSVEMNSVELNNTFDFSILNQPKVAPPSEQVQQREPSQAPVSHAASPVSSNSPSPSSSKAPRGGVTKEKASTTAAKVDDLGITIYKRKPRTAPSKPVEIPTDGDDVSAKRAKNTEAARRSRARKLERMSQLEQRIRSLMDENEASRSEIAVSRENQK